VADTFNFTEEVDVVGTQNAVDGAQSTVQILGFKNTAQNVSEQGIATVNTVMVGSQNTATNTGLSGTNAYQELFGHLNNLHDCSRCLAVGANVNESTSDTMGIGMAATPEIIVQAGSVNITAWPVTQIQAKIFTGCTVVSGTYNECTTATQTWTKPFADANYALVCMAQGTTLDSGLKESYIIYEDLAFPKTATQFRILEQNNRGSTPISAVQISCTGTHP
jgi:hypothetical protein